MTTTFESLTVDHELNPSPSQSEEILYPRPTGGRKPAKSARQLPVSDAPAAKRHGYFKSFDGTRLFYSIEGTGKPLIFCYGLVCSSLHWTYQIEHFKKNYQTIWFDYRGHQNSDCPTNLESLTIESIARDLGFLMDDLGIQDAVLFGHSMGVNVVLDFYRQHPKRVAGMILANGTAKRPFETAFKSNALDLGYGILQSVQNISPKVLSTLWKLQPKNPFTHMMVALGGFNPHLTSQEDIDLYVKQVSAMDPAILVQLMKNYRIYDATAWLHTIEVPSLIVAGEGDMMVPIEQQELLKQLIPDSRLEVIKHGSHCPQLDLPELFNLKVEGFLRELSY